MSTEYVCNQDLSNLGNLDCLTKQGPLKRIILVPLFDADGDANEFANEAAVTKSALQAKFDAALMADRFFPTPELKNVKMTREDWKVETDDYGIDYPIRQGTMSFEAMIWGASYNLMRRMSAFNFSNNLGFYGIDNKGNFIYLTDAATRLKVLPIPLKSFQVTDVPAGTDAVQKAMMKFKLDLEESETYLIDYIDEADLDFDGLSTVDVYSLYDVTFSLTSSSSTAAVVKALIDNKASQPLTGLVKADFTLKDDAGGSETISTVTDNNDGTYTFAWSTLSADTYVLTYAKSRYSFSPASLTFTIT